jgi:Reverse transcriptase (RNA-dependent DNA polymerase)
MQKLTVYNMPEYNGISEHLNWTLLEWTCALLHSSKLPKNLWGEAITHAVWLKNRTPTHILGEKTPFKVLYRRKLDLGGLKEWGNEVWVHTMAGTKLDGCLKIGRWLRFKEISNGHCIYWPEKCSVTVERSIEFVNGDMILLSILSTVLIQGEKGESNEVDKKALNLQRTLKNESKLSQLNEEQEHALDDEKPPEEDPIGKNDSIQPDKWLETPFNRVTDELIAARSCWVKIPSRYIRDIQKGVGIVDNWPSQPNLPSGLQLPITEMNDKEQIELVMAAAVSEIEAIDPQSLKEAMCQPDWPKLEIVIKAELDALKKAGTWGVVEWPKRRNIVKNKWVFRIKKDDTGKVEHYKAHLVAKGFTQVHGVDYYDTWAPVTKLAFIRLLLAITTQNDWTVDMFDFHSTFLNGKLDSDEEVFMEQPYRYEQSDGRRYVCKLFKSLYGLKQADCKWYDVLCRTLAEIRFKQSDTDPAVFYIHQGSNIIVLACHVNDCTIIGMPHDLVQSYKDKLKMKYSLTDLGPVKWLLGIKVTRDLKARTVSLSQLSYIDSILTCFNFTDLKPFATPMDPLIWLSKDQCPQTLEEVADMCKVPYREAVGSLNYCAVVMRLDIAFFVSLLAQFMENPGRIHWEAIKQVFRYLSGTKN